MNICICASVHTWKRKTIFWVYMRENSFSHSHPFCWIMLKAFAIFQKFQEPTDLTMTFPLKWWRRNLLYPALFKFSLYRIQFALLYPSIVSPRLPPSWRITSLRLLCIHWPDHANRPSFQSIFPWLFESRYVECLKMVKPSNLIKDTNGW